MKSKNTPEPSFVPFVRPPEIEAMRNQARAALNEYIDDDLINDEQYNGPAYSDSTQRIIRIDENGFRKIVDPDGTEYDYLEDDDDDDADEDEPSENNYEYDNTGAFTIRSGADWYAQNDDDLLPEAQLFGDLWMQNDLCIMFADTNAGKSILAVQIADSISRGLPIPGIGCTAEPAPVLYFDFELSDHQFRSRYSSAETGKYPFTGGFFRATLNAHSPKQRRFKTFEEFISNEIENALLCCKAKTLIIDNITCLRYGAHNTAGALNLMQYLQGIKRTYQLSILVLAHTPKRNPSKPITRNDLQGSKMLINLADSAFAIGESRQQPDLKYLKQIKQRGAPETHGPDNICLGRITRTGSFMHFTFGGSGHESDHLAPQTEQYRRATEQRIGELHRQNHSIRQIAAQLGLAPTTIFRALKKLEKCGKEEDVGCADEERCADVQICECADEETQCADVPMCECADEEVPMDEPAAENQYMDVQLKAPARAPGSPLERGRGVFSKTVTPYEAQTHDDPNALPQSCHTEALEVRPKPVPLYEAQTHDDPNAPTLAQGSPLERGRGVFSKPVPPYEAQSHDDPKALPQSCHTEAQACPEDTRREVQPKPVPPHEAQSHDDHNTNNYRTSFIQIHPSTSMPKGQKRNSTLLQPGDNRPRPVPHEKQATSKSNTEIPGYEPEGGFLTIDDEIDGLSYLEKYAPMLFTAEYKSRLRLLEKMKEGVLDG